MKKTTLLLPTDNMLKNICKRWQKIVEIERQKESHLPGGSSLEYKWSNHLWLDNKALLIKSSSKTWRNRYCLNNTLIEVSQSVDQIITQPWPFRGTVLCAKAQPHLTCFPNRSSSKLSSDKFLSLFCHWLSSVQKVLPQVFKDMPCSWQSVQFTCCHLKYPINAWK